MDGFAHTVFGGLGHAELLLDALGGGLTDQQIVVAADERNDGFVHLVTADTYGSGIGKTAKRKHCDFGGAAANVHDH